MRGWTPITGLGVLAAVVAACSSVPVLHYEEPDAAEDAPTSDGGDSGPHVSALVDAGDAGGDEPDGPNPCPSDRYSCCDDLLCKVVCTIETCAFCAELHCDPAHEYCCSVGGSNVPVCKPYGAPCGKD